MNSTTYQFPTPEIRYLGYLTWLVLLLFSIIFYKERAVFLDGGFQLVEIINAKSFKIYHNRPTHPLTQILALMAIYLKLPLKWVMVAFSINFILFFAGIYHIIVRYLKNDFLGWVQLFFFTLLVLDRFYFLTSELFQGMSLLCLWFAVLLRYSKLSDKRTVIFLMILLIPIIFNHKLLSPFFLFFWVFFFLEKPELRHIRYYGLLVWMFLIAFWRSRLFTNWYERAKQVEFWNNFDQYYPNFHLIPAHQKFLVKAFEWYYFYPLFLGTVVIIYGLASLKKLPDWQIKAPVWKLLLVITANIGYVLMAHIGNPESKYRFYSELTFMAISVLVSLPLLFDFFSKLKNTKLVAVCFFVLIIIRLTTIGINHQTFENRNNWYLSQLKNSNYLQTNRLIIKEAAVPMDTMLMTWSASHETLLLSAIPSPDSAKTLLIATDEAQYMKYLEEENCFLTNFKKMEAIELNQDYFRLKKGKYKLIER